MSAKYVFLSVGISVGVIVGAFAGHSLTAPPSVTSLPIPHVPPTELAGVQDPVQSPAALGLPQIVELQSYVDQRASLYNLAMLADKTALIELLEQAQALPARHGDWVLPILYGRYGEIDGAAALADLRSRGHGSTVEPRELSSLFMAWLRVDEAAAMETLGALAPQQRLQVGAMILRSDTGLSESQRQALADRLGMGRHVGRLASASRVRLSDNPEAQLDELLNNSDYGTRQMSLTLFMGQWARRNPEAAMAALARVPGLDMRRYLQEQVIGQWAQNDATAAFEWAMAQPPSTQRRQHWQQALQSMASQNPRGAMAMIDRLNPEDRDAATRSVLSIWGMIDPQGAAEWLDVLQGSAMRTQAVGQIAHGYARQYPGQALQWLKSLTGREQSLAALSMMASLAEIDASTATSILDMIDDSEQAVNAARNLVLNWAQRDPEAAVAWIHESIAADQRPRVLPGALQQWAQYDTEAALRYADRLEDLPEREHSLVAVLPFLRTDPARAEAYYEALTLPEARQRAAAVLYRSWRHTDPERAESFRVAAGIEEGADDTRAIMGGMGRAQALPYMGNRARTLAR